MGFGVAQFRAKVQSLTGQSDADYTPRHAAYDLKKLRDKRLITKMGRSRRYDVSPTSTRALTALLVLRDHVIQPVLACVHTAQPELFAGTNLLSRSTLPPPAPRHAAPLSRIGIAA